MNLPKAPPTYSAEDQNGLRAELERRDAGYRKKSQDIDIVSQRLILTSPGGVRWALVVDDAGAVSTEAA